MDIKNTTICAVIDEAKQQILMVQRKRGMKGFSKSVDGKAKGFFNLPGGKCNQAESFLDCAIRETREETGIIPLNPRFIGQLNFLWPDLIIVNRVFIANHWAGGIGCNIDECIADWCDISKIPFDQMWPCDKIWIPEMLAGRAFHFDIKDDKAIARPITSFALSGER
ncbi:MAG: 8-oxo-dGTP diphosphatase [Rickettsiales bacterium]|jgi:8-oxo-dGTP diphosphatase|nr:8-oxo-dGTP diphosphatase [Rickettsiales bacterium]